MLGLARRVDFEPFLEQRRHFERQLQHGVARALRAGGGGALEDGFELGVGERRDHRCRHHRNRNAGLAQRGNGFDAPLGRGGARLERSRELAIERRHRHRHRRQAFLRHLGQDVDVALDQRRFGDDGDGMPGLAQHFENAAHDLEFAFGRLVGIGVGAERDRRAAIGGLGELGPEQPRRLGLDQYPAFEIEPGRQAQIGVGRAREAIDAAMLAAAIGVDRTVERDVGGIVARDDGLGGVDGIERVALGRLLVGRAPAVVERLALLGLEAAGHVASGAAAFQGQRADQVVYDLAVVAAVHKAGSCAGRVNKSRTQFRHIR